MNTQRKQEITFVAIVTFVFIFSAILVHFTKPSIRVGDIKGAKSGSNETKKYKTQIGALKKSKTQIDTVEVNGKNVVYTVLNKTQKNAPSTARLKQDICIPGYVSEERVNEILHAMYQLLLKQRGGMNNARPNEIYIFVYSSEQKYNADKSAWKSSLQKQYDQKEPKVILNEQPWFPFSMRQSRRFGLIEGVRKGIYRAILRSEDFAIEVAQRLHPLNNVQLNTPQFAIILKKQQSVQREIVQERFKILSNMYNLTAEQLQEIELEGINNHWLDNWLVDEKSAA
ncbi:MAG: hypothetical protein KKH94_02700 [Candidatus Omnitrophica bacterium]|nr:hypothetical protein [Candidatus Omnitrophota bacterium]